MAVIKNRESSSPTRLLISRIIGQIPNFLSCSRIVMAFMFPFAEPRARLYLVIFALLSEFFDGFLARRLNAVTPLGQALDPIADKLFVLATVLVLILEKRLSWLHFSLIAMRDIVVALGAISVTLESRTHSLRYLLPRISGKITTAFQFALLICLYARVPHTWPLLVVTAIISCLSAIDYLYSVLHRRFDQKPETASL